MAPASIMVLMGLTTVLALSSLPPQSEQSTRAQIGPYSAEGLAAKTQSDVFIMTTATTQWTPPTFATSTPSPCQNNMCPALDGKTCIDSMGHIYGVLCDQRVSGVAITSSGKHRILMERDDEELVERSYTGSFDVCASFCDEFDKQYCLGVGYSQGVCRLYAAMQGTIAQAGGMACVRQN